MYLLYFFFKPQWRFSMLFSFDRDCIKRFKGKHFVHFLLKDWINRLKAAPVNKQLPSCLLCQSSSDSLIPSTASKWILFQRNLFLNRQEVKKQAGFLPKMQKICIIYFPRKFSWLKYFERKLELDFRTVLRIYENQCSFKLNFCWVAFSPSESFALWPFQTLLQQCDVVMTMK